jgi:hypothetical protein
MGNGELEMVNGLLRRTFKPVVRARYASPFLEKEIYTTSAN